MSPRALVFNATNLLIRGFMTTATDRQADSGEPTGALFAVARTVGRAFAFKEPEAAVAIVEETANAEWPELLQKQASRLRELFLAHGITVVSSPRPADLAASYTRTAIERGFDVVVVGSDKRLAQLVADDVWWYDAYKDVRYTPELVRKRFEVGPDMVADWLALVGDDDTLPGVKGIGKKGATTLLSDYGSLNAAIADAPSITGRTGKALNASLEHARAEGARAVLHRDLPLPASIDSITFKGRPAEGLEKLFAQLGFFELLSPADAVELAVSVCDDEDALSSALAAFSADPVSMQVLTNGPTAVSGKLVGIALAQGGAVLYVPFSGKGDVLKGPPPRLIEFLGDPDRPLVGHDTKDAIVAFARLGVEVRGVIADSACASHLHEPSNWAPQDLTLVARFVLHEALPEQESIRGVGKRTKAWSAIGVETAAAYAGRLADAAERVWLALEATTSAELMAEYLALSQTLIRMELIGIAVDADDLAEAGEDFERIAAELETEIHKIAGKTFNIGSTKQLGSVLFEDLELPILKRTKTGWSTANEALERVEHAHPIVSLVMRWRRLRRLKDSWVVALLKQIGDDGRVRSTFNPARSFSGRLVNSHPDLGRVPGRTPEMVRIRHAFTVSEGNVLLSLDYKQLGLYVLAHLTGDPALVDPLRERRDMHVLTAAAVLELSPEAVDDDQRHLGKLVNFATFAGQGASALALQLGVSAAEAKEFIRRFDDRYSMVREFQDEQLRLARERGYIETIAGRRWPIGGLASLDPMLLSYAERLARRATHEGSVADVSRRGLLDADRALRAASLSASPLLQVHDEVLFEVPESELTEAARVAGVAMREAFSLAVPLQVGCKAGPNWAELDPFDVDLV